MYILSWAELYSKEVMMPFMPKTLPERAFPMPRNWHLRFSNRGAYFHLTSEILSCSTMSF